MIRDLYEEDLYKVTINAIGMAFKAPTIMRGSWQATKTLVIENWDSVDFRPFIVDKMRIIPKSRLLRPWPNHGARRPL